MDGAGDLALTQDIIENYRKAKPHLVSKVTYTKAPQPEIPGKLKAQQAANRLDIDVVLTAYDGLSIGTEQGVYMQFLPAHAALLPRLDEIYQEPARKIQALTKGYGVVVTYCPYGPLFEYMPDRVKSVPGTAEELLAWTRANKNRFMYARPVNSGVGNAFLFGLPYILKDANPKDPIKGWDKTWAYLKALGENIEYYPAGTAAAMVNATAGLAVHPGVAATTASPIAVLRMMSLVVAYTSPPGQETEKSRGGSSAPPEQMRSAGHAVWLARCPTGAVSGTV
mgnify:CR=1 FL=1